MPRFLIHGPLGVHRGGVNGGGQGEALVGRGQGQDLGVGRRRGQQRERGQGQDHGRG